MARALLPLMFMLAACTPADPPLLIDEGKAPAVASDQPGTAAGAAPATQAADD